MKHNPIPPELMSNVGLVKELVQKAYDSGYYSGKHEDGEPHHLAAIKERNLLSKEVVRRLTAHYIAFTPD